MQLVEKHIISRTHWLYPQLNNLCFLSKNLFNYANYLIRQKFIATGEYLNYYQVDKLAAGTPDYIALPAKVSQQTLLRLHESWKSFFQATATYNQQKSLFESRPKLPKYKHKTAGRNVVTYTQQAISKTWLKKGIIHLSKTSIFLPTRVKAVNQVRIVPKTYHIVVEVVYEVLQSGGSNDGTEAIAGIDIGLNNLATIVSNQAGLKPVIVNGRPLKALNAYYNKQKAKSQSCLPKNQKTSKKIQRLTHKRNCKIDNYLHNASRFIIDCLVANRIGTLVIGKNDGWKQSINLGKRNNQNFVSVPHARFIKMLTYKAQLAGMEVIITEESYTSKCSLLDNEPIGKHSLYQGRRIKRGLFRASDGTCINADVNGSANIVRKVFPNAFAEGIQGVVVRPVRVTPYKTTRCGK
ncbi:transposase [Microcoleus sp. ARI1-A1]|uniref:RNA-guided endonuclease InsQ/TnpB family protein n=1 Tax=unclassified Microcoleus TaxID=2642155 RepID=UPI002FD0F1F2